MEISHRPWQSHHTEAQTKGPRWRLSPNVHPVNSSTDRKCGEDFALAPAAVPLLKLVLNRTRHRMNET